MNKVLASQRLRAARMKSYFTKKGSYISPCADIVEKINAFTKLLIQFDRFAASHRKSITGYALQKRHALKVAAQISAKWGVRCHIKAMEAGNRNLAILLNHSAPAIERLSDLHALYQLKNMRSGMNNNLSIFSSLGLTPAIILEITNSIASYESLIGEPVSAIALRKMKTQMMQRIMKQVNAQLATIVALLKAQWSFNEDDLIIEMENNYRLHAIGHHSTGIKGKVVTANSQPPSGYTIICESIKKEAVSDIVGTYSIQNMKPGTFEFRLVSPDGTVVKTAIITIKRGTMLHHEWIADAVSFTSRNSTEYCHLVRELMP